MRKVIKYEDVIKVMPLEHGGRDLTSRIILASGISDRKSGPKRAGIHPGLPQQIPQVITCLGLVLVLLVCGCKWPYPQSPVSERMGINTAVIWAQVADGFRSTLVR